MIKLQHNLNIDRCPHCSVSKPYLGKVSEMETNNHSNTNRRFWRIYKCNNCGGLVTATAANLDQAITEMFPKIESVDDAIPERAREFLKQSIATVHAPAGAVMLAASAVDSMLKEKGYKDGSLYKRIEQAASDHLITAEMASWAHEVRLDANDQRHADENAPLPTETDAKRVIDFVSSLAQFLFVLPSKIQRGIESAKQ